MGLENDAGMLIREKVRLSRQHTRQTGTGKKLGDAGRDRHLRPKSKGPVALECSCYPAAPSPAGFALRQNQTATDPERMTNAITKKHSLKAITNEDSWTALCSIL
jgi:hypothetical protein